MNTSQSSLSISKNLTSLPQKDHSGTPEDMFKTSNPKIFPSLHPLSALYRQKIPNSDLSESKKIEEPSKKLRCENGSQKVLPPVQNTTPIKVSIKQEKKKKISPNPIKNVPFSKPNLPTRFGPMDMAQLQEQNVSEEFVKIPQLFEPCSEPLLIPDNMGSIINRSIFLQNNFGNDIETLNQDLIAKAPLSAKHIHDNGIFDMTVKNPMINKYCESLRLEYFSIQAKKNVLEMQQERIVQTLKSILSSEATLQKNDSLETACSLKEEEVKQEFFL